MSTQFRLDEAFCRALILPFLWLTLTLVTAITTIFNIDVLLYCTLLHIFTYKSYLATVEEPTAVTNKRSRTEHLGFEGRPCPPEGDKAAICWCFVKTCPLVPKAFVRRPRLCCRLRRRKCKTEREQVRCIQNTSNIDSGSDWTNQTHFMSSRKVGNNRSASVIGRKRCGSID